MICPECEGVNHKSCTNVQKGTVTWCDCQHENRPHIDQQMCKHLRWQEDSPSCPTCGLTLKQFYQRESALAIAEATEGAANDG